MRILVVSDLYPPRAGGGYERSCADVVDRWRRAGHHVVVVTSETDHSPTVEPDGRDDVHHPEPDVHRVLPFGTDPAPADEDRARAAVEACVGGFRPDVVSAWNLARVPQRAVLTAIGRCPVVFVACDGWLARAPRDVPRPAVGSRIVWVSDDLRRRIEVPAWAPTDQAVVGSGIDRSLFPGRAVAPRPWRGRLLFAGRLSPLKGVDDAVAALVHLPADVRLRVVGATPPGRRAELDRLAADCGVTDRLSFGESDRAGMPAVYRDADVVLFPSRWAEPFGLVPLEAMACGTPVVASGTGGSAGYLRDGVNCVLAPPENPAALAAAVRRLAGDPALRARLVRHGLRTSRRHGIDEVAASLAGELERAVARVPIASA